MTPAMTVRCILAGMLGDVADYRRLRALLDAQFSAALRHRAEEISDIVGRIVELTAVLERRRRERVELAGACWPARCRPHAFRCKPYRSACRQRRGPVSMTAARRSRRW